MVDSRTGESMADRIDELTGRVEAVEQKVDRWSVSVDQRFEQVDAALVEQRLYTEFVYERLDSKMDAGFARLDAKMDAGFASVDARFASVDGRFDSLEGHFNRLERKLDQFIDTQSRANALVERRLQALEPPSSP